MARKLKKSAARKPRTKAAATATRKPAPKAPAARKATAGGGKLSPVCEAFGARPGTNRAKLLDRLAASMGKPVAVTDLAKAVYGDADRTDALGMVLKGALWMIETRKPGYRLVKSGGRGAIAFALEKTR